MPAAREMLPGTEVRARGLKWEVVSSQSLGTQTLYRLRGLEGAVNGHELDVLHDFESIEPLQRDLCPERAAPITNWLVYHQAFLLEQALGPSALLAVQPGRLRIEPYQLVPVLRAIRMSRVRMMLADGVGLGKTIQAGMVITELIARRLAHRILIVSPAGPLLDQWRVEMSERFGLRLDVIDRARLEEIRRGSELGTNPFDQIPLGLVSIDFLKQDRVLDQLERASYDVVIIDEAHHCADSGSSQSREDSQRRKLAHVLARQCDSLLLLTATPHDGNDSSFASLCELLDPSLVDGRGALRGERYRAHIVRRLKKHVLVEDSDHPGERRQLFPDREVTPVPVTTEEPQYRAFRDLEKGLLDLIAPELRRAVRNRNYSDVLAWIALLKRSVSTVTACQKTLQVVAARFQELLSDTAGEQEARRQELKTLREQRIRTLHEYERKLARFGAITATEEQERGLLEAEDLAHQLVDMQRALRRGSREQASVTDIVAHLDDLASLAEDAVGHDPKINTLIDAIRTIRRDEPRANVLIYTEYIDSQMAVLEAIRSQERELGPAISMNGLDDERVRAHITQRFRTNDNLILVSTDSAAEGLNMHQRCHHLIHLELPFNPNRLEQRNGRIDRYGQKLTPFVQYLYLKGTFEERILLRLIAKYERQRARLTFVPNTLGLSASADSLEERLLKGLMDEDRRLFQDEPTLFNFERDDEATGADEATRELLEEIDRTLHGFRQAAQTNAWLADVGLNAEEGQVREATAARNEGNRAEHVDLASFVTDAIRLDNGEVVGSLEDATFAARLPSNWAHGLDELPGYDQEHRLVRLTTKLDVTSDSENRPVGFLGRAHPLVRRAVDRVRNLSFGSAIQQGQDPRASVVKAPVSEPTILYTFLARVLSGNGRELERVLAVSVSKSGETHYFGSPDDWNSFCDPDKGIRTTDVWKDQFANWASHKQQQARQVAAEGFADVAAEFIRSRQETLERERAGQADWLKQRADEIMGRAAGMTDIQRDLFDPSQPALTAARPQWQSLTDPAARLAAFHQDRNQTPAARGEAEGVLRIYQQRMKVLEGLLDLRGPEIVPLGLLMLVPEGPHAA